LEVTKKVLLEAVFCDQGLLTEIQQSIVRAAEGSSSGGFFLPPNLSYLSYEDSRKRSIKLEILSVKELQFLLNITPLLYYGDKFAIQLNLPSIGIILIGIFFHHGVVLLLLCKFFS